MSGAIWLEEELEPDLKWSMQVSRILHTGQSEFQQVALVETPRFGKILLLDGKSQSAEFDEAVYHELLVHPAMLHHPNPKAVFICGGGEGATAREVLRHKSVEKCVMVDIDKVVCDFCRDHLEVNKEAFADPRLELIIDDAKAQLENYPGKFDVIIGDLADPVSCGPCYHLYTAGFYKDIICNKLNPGGIFVTQSAAAGVLSHTQVFTPVNRTLQEVFPTVVPYSAHVPSFCDTWGWNMAFSSTDTQLLGSEEFEKLLSERIEGETKFLDGDSWMAAKALNKIVRSSLAVEKRVLTGDNPVFLHGTGIKALQ
mmetsp:Transcript_23336/g.64747  ORF Transcript_23336/g.64747 Transcript_23336/m.64747 type:complete len:312 (+) Transcript_23336:156-1091(+)|eukprot:CAMPEP_0117671738 /NCGR_PEP_ID=MMETSP0804-20121206/13510_1 /TAXON_ID=1074897 /ORGANISM="Tetraselmis astigmatica, Strain CCMP880" /LENGTH=311 /DNA_ID=CAMNT_0005480251 /DNA_START=102 /DNA_END=1037 /DNA_ORIENTATION=-